ncbi:RNA-directed DNA polymerase, eukaryota, reverse transcriptase zinc-binding domain protein [Tanacetum coccineum]
MSRCRNWEPLIDRRFFWGGNTEVDKVAWIAWDKALLPRTNGGLGIGSLKPSNQSLLAKWRAIRSQQEYEEITTLTNLLIGLHLSTNQDTWEFTLGALRTFTVNCMRKIISSTSHNPNSLHTRWNKLIPLKVNILAWRVSKKRIPTRYNLDRRRIDLHSSRCPVCDNDIETEEHLFVKCPIAIASWKMVFSWWQLVDIPLSNLGDVLTMAERTPMTKAQKKFFDAMVNTTI